MECRFPISPTASSVRHTEPAAAAMGPGNFYTKLPSGNAFFSSTTLWHQRTGACRRRRGPTHFRPRPGPTGPSLSIKPFPRNPLLSNTKPICRLPPLDWQQHSATTGAAPLLPSPPTFKTATSKIVSLAMSA